MSLLDLRGSWNTDYCYPTSGIYVTLKNIAWVRERQAGAAVNSYLLTNTIELFAKENLGSNYMLINHDIQWNENWIKKKNMGAWHAVSLKCQVKKCY